MKEIMKEILEIVEYRKKHRENSYGWCTNRKYSIARLKRLRLLLTEMIRKEEQ